MKNPYKRDDHRTAFEKAVELIKSGLHWRDAAKQLDPQIQRENRMSIAAKASRILKDKHTAG